jgi:kynureninase
MEELRHKSVSLTTYLESLLARVPFEAPPQDSPQDPPFTIITPRNPDERGAQLSIRLKPGLLHLILRELDHHSVVVDERKPDVIRVAPAPLYNTYVDVWNFVHVFLTACRRAVDHSRS